MIKIVAILAGVALALVVAAAFAYSAFDIGPGHTRTETRAFPSSVRTLSLKTSAGDIDVVRGDRVVLRETHHYHASGEPAVSHVLDGDTLTVEDHGCTGHGWMHGCSTDFHLEVPAGVALRIKSNAGDLRATGIEIADLQADTDAGDVTVDKLTAPNVRAESDAGDVRLELLSAPSLIQARTDAGDVDIAVPGGTYAITTDTKAGEADVRRLVNDPGAANRIDASTDAGDVTISSR